MDVLSKNVNQMFNFHPINFLSIVLKILTARKVVMSGISCRKTLIVRIRSLHLRHEAIPSISTITSEVQLVVMWSLRINPKCIIFCRKPVKNIYVNLEEKINKERKRERKKKRAKDQKKERNKEKVREQENERFFKL